MGLIEKVAQIDKKFSWSFFGFIFAAIFGGIAIYTGFFRDTSPVVKYEILSNTKILDVREDVSGLSIIYNAEDIRKAHKTLSVLIVRISNEGRSPILKTYYDDASPLGLGINSGEVIKAEIIGATTEYLRQNAGIRVRDPSNVEFSQVIIEPNESFTTKFLILNPEQSTLAIFPKGKIACTKKLLLADLTTDQMKETFLLKVISGSFWVQVVRIPVYVLSLFLLLIIIFGPIAYILNKKDQIKKNRVVRRFKLQANASVNELNEKIYEYYKRYELSSLKRMRKALANKKEFQNLLGQYEAEMPKTNGNTAQNKARSLKDDQPYLLHSPAFVFQSMLNLDLISKDGDTYARNEERIRAMSEFIQFASTKK